jgi:hypothetical protein
MYVCMYVGQDRMGRWMGCWVGCWMGCWILGIVGEWVYAWMDGWMAGVPALQTEHDIGNATYYLPPV